MNDTKYPPYFYEPVGDFIPCCYDSMAELLAVMKKDGLKFCSKWYPTPFFEGMAAKSNGGYRWSRVVKNKKGLCIGTVRARRLPINGVAIK